MKLLITGGQGLLGNEFFKIAPLGMEIFSPKRELLDILNYNQVKKVFNEFKPDVTLHLAAYTDVGKAEAEKRKCYEANVIGTANIARFSKHLIYLSTEYVFDGERGNYQEEDIPNPVNFYSLTKLLGEFEAKKAPRHTIIRTLFKPRPFEHQYVCTDMWTSGRYVDEIAKEVAFAVEHAEKLPKAVHIGFERIALFDLAKQTRGDLILIKRSCLPIRLPRDTTLNTKLWRKFKDGYSK